MRARHLGHVYLAKRRVQDMHTLASALERVSMRRRRVSASREGATLARMDASSARMDVVWYEVWHGSRNHRNTLERAEHRDEDAMEARSGIGLFFVHAFVERVRQLACLALRRFPLSRPRVSLFLERMIRSRTNMDTKSEYSFKLSTSGSLTP